MERARDGKFADAPLDGAGFEPPVSLKAPGVLVFSVLVRVDFSVGGDSGRDDISRSRNLVA
jgi:hypothetical protein